MAQDYIVSLAKTTFHKGEYNESKYDYEYTTYDEALEKYDQLVASESKHVSGLTHVRCDAVIKMVNPFNSIARRVRISN